MIYSDMRRYDPLDPEAGGLEPGDFEQHADAPAWSAGVGCPAGIYWLAGRCTIVGHGTAAEAVVRVRGGILVGTLRFGPGPYETRRPSSEVRRLAAWQLVEESLYGDGGRRPIREWHGRGCRG